MLPGIAAGFLVTFAGGCLGSGFDTLVIKAFVSYIAVLQW